ncbi:hypothetical protein TSUD_160220 [Trifolium subterraneum]|uniref:Uncharacterized protein n=1 Tax=Trifolium subterraneum TaxID=3900 RepID=A0A2Z6NEN6_TRISU|nr:hypothetical protein TSUD_160220 [Trifolium subterraneum]
MRIWRRLLLALGEMEKVNSTKKKVGFDILTKTGKVSKSIPQHVHQLYYVVPAAVHHHSSHQYLVQVAEAPSTHQPWVSGYHLVQ